jgi:hypothetical protein
MHFTQQPSKVSSRTNTNDTVLFAALQGFITLKMLREELASWDERHGECLPAAMLIDLHDARGYGPGTASAARRWLQSARKRGVKRIAFIARSTVVRTIVKVISPDVRVEMQCFQNDESAIAWLHGKPAAQPAKSSRSRPRARP